MSLTIIKGTILSAPTLGQLVMEGKSQKTEEKEKTVGTEEKTKTIAKTAGNRADTSKNGTMAV